MSQGEGVRVTQSVEGVPGTVEGSKDGVEGRERVSAQGSASGGVSGTGVLAAISTSIHELGVWRVGVEGTAGV